MFGSPKGAYAPEGSAALYEQPMQAVLPEADNRYHPASDMFAAAGITPGAPASITSATSEPPVLPLLGRVWRRRMTKSANEGWKALWSATAVTSHSGGKGPIAPAPVTRALGMVGTTRDIVPACCTLLEAYRYGIQPPMPIQLDRIPTIEVTPPAELFP